MILLDHKHWQKLNQVAMEIHAANSRDALADLVIGSLPTTLCAEEAWWSEHGPEEPRDGDCASTSFQEEILPLLLARAAPTTPVPPVSDSRQNGLLHTHHNVFELSSLIPNHRRHKSDFLDGLPGSGPGHHLITQFFITAESGVLLTVRNSRSFTDEQKFSLSLLREHIAIAARRHHRCPPESMANPPFVEVSLLSQREKEVLPYLVHGMTNPEIASALGISPRTVEKHVASILDKSGLDNRRMLIGLKPASTLKKFPC